MEPCQETYTISKRTTKIHSTHPRRMSTPGCVNKRDGGKRVCGAFRSEYAYGQPKRLDTAELETMRTFRSPTMVMTANSEVRTTEEATVYVKKLDLFVTAMLLEETPAVLSFGKLCEDHGYTYHWTSGQNHNSHQKRQGN